LVCVHGWIFCVFLGVEGYGDWCAVVH
jgi:hypothetical protein